MYKRTFPTCCFLMVFEQHWVHIRPWIQAERSIRSTRNTVYQVAEAGEFFPAVFFLTNISLRSKSPNHFFYSNPQTNASGTGCPPKHLLAASS